MKNKYIMYEIHHHAYIWKEIVGGANIRTSTQLRCMKSGVPYFANYILLTLGRRQLRCHFRCCSRRFRCGRCCRRGYRCNRFRLRARYIIALGAQTRTFALLSVIEAVSVSAATTVPEATAATQFQVVVPQCLPVVACTHGFLFVAEGCFWGGRRRVEGEERWKGRMCE